MEQIYKSSFILGSQRSSNGLKEPTLEGVIELAKVFLGRHFSDVELEGFEGGLHLERDDGKVVESIISPVIDDPMEAAYFGMTLQHPDAVKSGFNWELTLAAVKTVGGQYQVEVTLSNGWVEERSSPFYRPISTPSLVPLLIRTYGARRKYDFSTEPTILDKDNIRSFPRHLFDITRELPIILISASKETNRPAANVHQVTYELSGIAYVYAMKHFAIFK